MLICGLCLFAECRFKPMSAFVAARKLNIGKFVKRWLVTALVSLLLSPAFPARCSAEKTADEKKNNAVMALHLEVMPPQEEAALSREFKDRFTKTLWRNWLAVMPEAAQLGVAGVVIVRFQIGKDGAPSAEPVVEQSPGEKLKPLTKSALSAIRDSTKSTHLPNSSTHSSIELRATFYYNQPAETVKR